MSKPALAILAAGVGSRYGGLKQIAPIDEYGNIIIDYSIYDALRAGFSRIVCIIKKEIEQDFRATIGKRIERHADVHYVFQELEMLPAGYAVPEGRTKPWGTGHALLCCKGAIDGPFAVINADDYYGRGAYATIYDYLCTLHAENTHAMVGYELQNTLTDHGAVTRGVCDVDGEGYLHSIEEIFSIRRKGEGGVYEAADGREVYVEKGVPVSMNLWGFHRGILDGLEAGFPAFLNHTLQENPLKGEYLLPMEVQRMMEEEGIRVRVLKSDAEWFGVTYREDLPIAKAALRQLKDQGVYPERLWSE